MSASQDCKVKSRPSFSFVNSKWERLRISSTVISIKFLLSSMFTRMMVEEEESVSEAKDLDIGINVVFGAF